MDHDSSERDPDLELVERARAELPYRTAAFQGLLERHFDPAFRRARRILRSREDAEDAVQEAFLNVFRALPGFRAEKPFHHWLDTIVLNSCLRTLRMRRRERLRRAAYRQEGGSGPAPRDPGDPMLRELLEAALDTLLPTTRVALVLRFVDGCSYPEIAELLGAKESTVKMQVSRGSALLRRYLLEHGAASGLPRGSDGSHDA